MLTFILQRTLLEWRTVFWIAFGVFNVTNVVYLIWASGDTQPWNTPHLMHNNGRELRGEQNNGYEDKEKNKNSTTLN